jgi:hypothetical protein
MRGLGGEKEKGRGRRNRNLLDNSFNNKTTIRQKDYNEYCIYICILKEYKN